MTLTPILERELRSRARNRAAYWSRFAAAFVGVMLCVPQLLWPSFLTGPAAQGSSVFNGIVIAGFVICCAACVLSADAISWEKREGTLPLLYLTRLKGFDILIAKLGSIGLASFCSLVAFLPLLMIPLLAGGVTGGEVLRKGLVLLDTLILALAAGLWSSARGTTWFETSILASGFLATLIVVPTLIGMAAGAQFGLPSLIGCLSPLLALNRASDSYYKVSPELFWISVLAVPIVAGFLVLFTHRWLRPSFSDRQGPRSLNLLPSSPTLGSEKEINPIETSIVRPASPPRSGRWDPTDSGDPAKWLFQRQPGLKTIIWLGAIISIAGVFLTGLGARLLWPSVYGSVMSSVQFAFSASGSALYAWAASRFFVEARRSGELEMLLTTINGRQLVWSHWAALKRLLIGPVILTSAPILLQAIFFLGLPGFANQWRFTYSVSVCLALLNIILGVFCVCWLALWFGFKLQGQIRAILFTLALAKGIPFAISSLWAVLRFAFPPWIGLMGYNGLAVCLPQIVIMLLYVWLIHLARSHLLHEVTGAEPLPLVLRGSFGSAIEDCLAIFRRARRWKPS